MNHSSSQSLAPLFLIGAISAAAVVAPFPGHAASLITGLGGLQGYGEGELTANDDSSTGSLLLPFAVNFFGTTYTSFYVNNNGNISFGAPVGAYTPSAFPGSSTPTIAPYWADVDTSNQPGGGQVFYNIDDPSTLAVTWSKVGYFSDNNSKLNDFQLVMSNKGGGNFDAEFRYAQLQWTTGDASGGSNGLGGTPALAGYDSGNGTDFAILPGSLSPSVLELVNTSNSTPSIPGLYQFSVRNGTPEVPPGTGVPGPFPLLGVAAAFGYSRKLRKRIKGSKSLSLTGAFD
jgi:hypothetical protein